MNLAWLILGTAILLGSGLYGLLFLRHMIKVIIALQIIGKATLLMVMSIATATQQLALGQSLALIILVADTLAAVIGLAIVMQWQFQLDADASELPEGRLS